MSTSELSSSWLGVFCPKRKAQEVAVSADLKGMKNELGRKKGLRRDEMCRADKRSGLLKKCERTQMHCPYSNF